MSVYFTNYAYIYDLNLYLNLAEDITNRSEERRVGKEC